MIASMIPLGAISAFAESDETYIERKWEDGKVVCVTVKSDSAKKAIVRINGKDMAIKFKDGIWKLTKGQSTTKN